MAAHRETLNLDLLVEDKTCYWGTVLAKYV